MATKKSTTEETQSIAVINEGSTEIVSNANDLPSFMQKHAGEGMENVGMVDIETPRIKLLQSTSPELEEFEEARAGMFWHSIGQMSLGRELTIVPIYVDHRAILWRPLKSGGGILARSDDGIRWNPPNASFDVKLPGSNKVVKWVTKPTVIASRLLEWGSSDPDDPNSQPAATKMYSIVTAMPDYPALPPSVITLQRSSVRAAKKFLGQLRLSRAPAFGCKFVLSSVREDGAEGPFYNYKFTPAGFVADETVFESYRGYYNILKEIGLQLKETDLQPDEYSSSGDSTDNTPSY